MTLNPGQQLAHFEVLKKLGEGGMGEVYLAKDTKLNRKVAIKTLPSEFADNKDRLERFTREARTAAGISHSNVMGIYDIGTAPSGESDKALNYIVMEHVNGEPLTDYLRRTDIGTQSLLKISEHIASGLAAAHKLNIVHRDIKTDNIIIDDDGEPRILDFGLAKPVASVFSSDTEDGTQTISQELTQEGKIVGTVMYMSPEQARGGQIDSRSDIFSFGILLYKMFTGGVPFDGDDRVSTIAKILESKHVPILQKNESLPSELQRIIDKCLQKNPNDRYQDTRDLVVDLRSLRRNFESGISETGSVITDYRPRKKTMFARSSRTEWIAGILVLIVAVALGSNFFGDSDGPAPYTLQASENALAILGFENKTADESLDWLQAGLPEILLTDLAENSSMTLISRNRVLDCLEERIGKPGDIGRHQECVDAAKSIGASTVLSGSFYKMGDKIRIDARLEDVESGKILLGEKVVGTDPFVLVDSLTQKIAQSLNIRDMMSDNTNVSSYTSSSPEAYKNYILGMEKFWQSLFDDAIAHFEKAIEIDTAFALPYTRIGMAYSFQNRSQQGVPYFALAKKFEDNLPLKERNLLDIYYDTWFEKKFDDAFIKLKTFVGNYPDDKEARTIYSLYLNQLANDKEGAMAQLDTVLLLDPQYMLGLESYARLQASQSNYDVAIEYAIKAKEFYPEAPGPYALLAGFYRRLARYDEAAKECEDLLKLKPGEESAIDLLVTTHINRRDFESARRAAEIYPEYHSNDPYQMLEYHFVLVNLANWEGKFKESIEHQHDGIEQALLTGDSTRITALYNLLAEHFLRVGEPDSAVHYSGLGNEWAPAFQSMDHAMLLIKADAANEPEARALLATAVSAFRAMVPEEMFPLLDNMQLTFDGYSEADTGKIIAGFEGMTDMPRFVGSGQKLDIGSIMINQKRYEEAIELLDDIVEGRQQTSRGILHVLALYNLGRANQGLGNTPEAVKNFQEVLNFWGKSDIELKEIADTRKRLGELVS